MRISHESIYQALCVEGRGALKRELVWCLRTRAGRYESRGRGHGTSRKAWGHVTADVVLSERPAEADRAAPGGIGKVIWCATRRCGTERR